MKSEGGFAVRRIVRRKRLDFFTISKLHFAFVRIETAFASSTLLHDSIQPIETHKIHYVILQFAFDPVSIE
jgi:hypothetical protein